ncbi:kinesin motor domain-containing protein [Phthorimaea operculella]|nr:kinesin motor domain-containing protein [Phthorimaea operculella]
MALKNLQLLQPMTPAMVYHHRQATPMRAPPTALSRNISKSAESLAATRGELRSRKARSTEQPAGMVKVASSIGLPALGKSWRDDDSIKSRSRNGSGSSRAASLDRSTRGSSTTLNSDEDNINVVVSTRGSSTTLNSDEDNINVVVRVRPLSDPERGRGEREMLEFPGKGQVIVHGGTPGQKAKVFSYNVVFEPAATQANVLEYSGIKRLLEMAVEGFSCTAFCYGQTGSGKTHTLTGPPGLMENGTSPYAADHGLVVRSFVYLFQLINERPDCHFILKASFLEIYNEKVIDLLNPGSARKPLQVRWSKESRSFYVENLFTVDCEELDDLFAVLEEGMKNRAVGAHAMNAHSSRSHTLLCVRVRRDLRTTGDVTCSTHGKINFVDLAGSEMTKRTHSTGKTLEEANNINRSLMVLGYCIAQLSDGKKKGHIPYRDSKLTKLLADSLAGNGVTLMIACIAPTRSNLSETINTLRYAARAKKIKTKPIVKMDARDALILSLKREVEALHAENQHLRTALHMQTDLNIETYKGLLSLKREVEALHAENQHLRTALHMQTDLNIETYSEYWAYNEDCIKGLLSLKRKVEALHAENQHLRTALHMQTDLNIETYNPRKHTPTQIPSNKLLQLPQSELVELVQLHMEENSALRRENSELFGVRDQLLRDQELLSRENERLLKKLEDVNSVCIRSPIIPARPAYSDTGGETNVWTNPSVLSATSSRNSGAS